MNIVLDFNSIDSLSFSGFEKRKAFLNPESGKNQYKEPEKKVEEGKEDEKQDEAQVKELEKGMADMMLEVSGLTTEEKSINTIDFIPEIIQVA